MLDRSSEVESAFARLGIGVPGPEEPPAFDHIPESADGEPIFEPVSIATAEDRGDAPAKLLTTVTPSTWKGTPIIPMRWLALHRIPAGDVTILSGDGGGGKTHDRATACRFGRE